MSIINLSGTSMMYGQIEWWVDSQDIATNTSRVVAHTLVRKSSQYTGTTGTFTGYVSVGGERSDGSYYGEVASDWVEVAYIAKTVQHDSTGNASVYIEGEVKGPSGTGLSGHKASGGATVSLPAIPRQASLTSAQDFTDESNPTIGYSNPAGNGVGSLQAAIYSSDEKTAYAAYRNVSKTGKNYTFDLTEEERNAIRAAIPNSNSMTVKFYLRCVIGSNTYYSAIAKTVTIVNGSPVFSPVLEEQNPIVQTLTGNTETLVRYVSNVLVTSNATAVKGASLSRQKITNGFAFSEASPATFNRVESDTFSFEATDSRNNSASTKVTKTTIPYVLLTCNIGSDTPDTDGNFTFGVSGNYYPGNFGAVDNTLTVEYRYRVSGQEFGEWVAMEFRISGNTYTASAQFTGLDYRATYIFQARAIDKVGTVETAEKPMRSVPVFDWGEKDFNINGDLNVNGDISILGKALGLYMYPVGSYYISDNDVNPGTIFGGTWERVQGRFLLAGGGNSGYALGSTGGETTHKMTTDEMPSHTHKPASGTGFATFTGGAGSAHGSSSNKIYYYLTDDTGAGTSATGGNKAHNNMPPYLTVSVWRRTG